MSWKLSGYSIGETAYKMIESLVPKGGTILELGSGEGTELLAKDYIVYSIEHNKDFIGKYNKPENYIHAPLVGFWYDVPAVKQAIGIKYDLLLIDGPDNSYGRATFMKYYNLFDPNALVIVDDVQKEHNLAVAYGINAYKDAKFYNSGISILNDSFKKKIAVIQ